MRLRLTDTRLALVASWCVALALLVLPRLGDAEDRMTVRGNYYRETSTRVVQPMVVFSKDLPDERLTLEAEYLLDAISSASIGQGAQIVGGDNVFTELRHETSLRARSQLGENGLGVNYRYSTETDYESNRFGLSYSRRLLQRTVTLGASYSLGLDRAYRIVSNLGNRAPWKSAVIDEDGSVRDGDTNLIRSHYLALGYSHTLHKTLLAGINLEGVHSTGPMDNPYRQVRNGNAETHPHLRRRIAPSVFAMWSIPKARLVIEPRYRFYADDWGIRGNNMDMRVHVRATKTLRIRARYRFYTQSEAFFQLDQGAYDPGDPYRTDDPKLDDFRSHTPGLELTWEFDGIARHRGLHWLKGGWIQANYNHVFVRCDDPSNSCSDQDFGYGEVRSTRYGDARLGSLAFSLAF